MIIEIISTIFILFLIASAYFFIRAFGPELFENSDTLAIAATPVVFAFFCGLTSLLGFFLPSVFAGISAFFIILFSGVLGFIRLKKWRQKIWQISIDWKNLIFDWALTAIFSVILILLILNSFITLPNGAISIDSGALVDAPYHLSQIIRFAETKYMDFEEPNFSGEFIRYPFFINLFSGLILKTGSSLSFSFYSPLILLAISGIFLILRFFRFLGLNNSLIFLSVTGTLFGAGLGYVAYIKTNGAIALPIRRNVPYPMQNISYPGMIPGFLIVQRAFILGFPLFITALFAFLKSLKTDSKKLMLWAAGITCLLPFAHTHSFFALIIFIGANLLYFLAFNRDLFVGVARFFVFPVFLITVPQLASLMLLPRYPLNNSFGFRFGWMSRFPDTGGINLISPETNKILPWLRYMWTNFGTLLFLPIVIVAIIKKFKESIVFLCMALGTLALWFIPNLIRFQVWDFDTNKFFGLAIFASIATVGLFVQSLSEHAKKIGFIIFSVAILFSIPSSLISLFNIFEHKNDQRLILFLPEEQETTTWLKNNTPDNSTILSSAAILTAKSVQNPIVLLSGRKTTQGFMAWLYTHGIDFNSRNQDINKFFHDPVANKNILADKKIPADYIIIDPIIRKIFPDFEAQLLSAGFLSCYKNERFLIVKLAF